MKTDLHPNEIINEGMVKIRIDAVGGDLDRVVCKYPASFMDEMARQLTPAIESACGVEGIAASSVELVMMFAAGTYMEHISDNVTYRRLMLADRVSAPRDFWVKWTRLEATEGEYNESNILFELGEDVDQKVREREYRYLLTSGNEKYHNSMSRKKVVEWREVIKRAAKRGELSKIEADFELAPETLELEERIADLLGKRIESKRQPEREEVPYITPENDEFARAMEKARRVVEEASELDEAEEVELEPISETDEESAAELEAESVELEPETAEDEEAPTEEHEEEPDDESDDESDEEVELDIFADEDEELEIELVELEPVEEADEEIAEEPEAEEPADEIPAEEPIVEAAEPVLEAAEPEEESVELAPETAEKAEDEAPEEESAEEFSVFDAVEISEEIEKELSSEYETLPETPVAEEPEEEAEELEIAELEIEQPREEPAPVHTTAYEHHTQQISIAERVADIRAELETKIRLEYEISARAKAERELVELRRELERVRSESAAELTEARAEIEKLRAEYEHLLEDTQRADLARAVEESRRRAEEEQLRAEIESQLRREAAERERLAEAARMAIEEQHRLQAENARIARQKEEEERAEAERQRQLEEERLEAERRAELERIQRERAEAEARARAAVPDMSSKKYTTTSKTVKLVFRRSVDPNITTRIQQIIKATVDYYGKDNVYLRIKAIVPDSQTVILEFADLPIEEMELLGNIIKILGNSGLGIAKAIID